MFIAIFAAAVTFVGLGGFALSSLLPASAVNDFFFNVAAVCMVLGPVIFLIYVVIGLFIEFISTEYKSAVAPAGRAPLREVPDFFIDPLPEGLRRMPKGPLNRSTGRAAGNLILQSLFATNCLFKLEFAASSFANRAGFHFLRRNDYRMFIFDHICTINHRMFCSGTLKLVRGCRFSDLGCEGPIYEKANGIFDRHAGSIFGGGAASVRRRAGSKRRTAARRSPSSGAHRAATAGSCCTTSASSRSAASAQRATCRATGAHGATCRAASRRQSSAQSRARYETCCPAAHACTCSPRRPCPAQAEAACAAGGHASAAENSYSDKKASKHARAATRRNPPCPRSTFA